MKRWILISAIIALLAVSVVAFHSVSNQDQGRESFWIKGQIYADDSRVVDLNEKLQSMRAKGQTTLDLYIMTGGGDIYSMIAICDLIINTPNIHVTGHVYGWCASAGVPILAVCDYRVAGAHTVFMLHKPNRSEILPDEDQTEMMDLNERLYVEILVDYSGLSLAKANEIMDEYTWFDVYSALSWGIIDNLY